MFGQSRSFVCTFDRVLDVMQHDLVTVHLSDRGFTSGTSFHASYEHFADVVLVPRDLCDLNFTSCHLMKQRCIGFQKCELETLLSSACIPIEVEIFVLFDSQSCQQDAVSSLVPPSSASPPDRYEVVESSRRRLLPHKASKSRKLCGISANFFASMSSWCRNSAILALTVSAAFNSSNTHNRLRRKEHLVELSKSFYLGNLQSFLHSTLEMLKINRVEIDVPERAFNFYPCTFPLCEQCDHPRFSNLPRRDETRHGSRESSRISRNRLSHCFVVKSSPSARPHLMAKCADQIRMRQHDSESSWS